MYPPETWYYGVCGCPFYFYNSKTDRFEQRCLTTHRRVSLTEIEIIGGFALAEIYYGSCGNIDVSFNYTDIKFKGETIKDQVTNRFNMERRVKVGVELDVYDTSPHPLNPIFFIQYDK